MEAQNIHISWPVWLIKKYFPRTLETGCPDVQMSETRREQNFLLSRSSDVQLVQMSSMSRIKREQMWRDTSASIHLPPLDTRVKHFRHTKSRRWETIYQLQTDKWNTFPTHIADISKHLTTFHSSIHYTHFNVYIKSRALVHTFAFINPFCSPFFRLI